MRTSPVARCSLGSGLATAIVGLLVWILVSTSTLSAQTLGPPVPDAGGMTVLIIPSETDGFEGRLPGSSNGPVLLGHRFYAEQQALEFVVHATNDARTEAFVDQVKLRAAFKVSVTSAQDDEIPVAVRWIDEVQEFDAQVPSPTFVEQPISIDAQRFAVWRFTVQRVDGLPFAFGFYVLTLHIEDFKSAVRSLDGMIWPGRNTAEGKSQRLIKIEPPGSVAERVRSFVLMADRARRLNDLKGELAAWSSAAAADPNNSSLSARVGLMLLVMGRYPEAAQVWEAIAGTWGVRGEIADSLATAYLGIGDEPRARQVLRQAGRVEASLSSDILQLRKRLRARVP